MVMEKYLIWHVQGGLGKNIAATALCKDIKEKYPDRKFILVCTYPEIFLNIPFIDKVYSLDNLSYFYETYIENKDVIIFKHDPYDQTGHITKKNHIIQSWCEILDLKYTNQTPTIVFNYAQQVITNKYTRSKPILLLQTNGGLPPLNTSPTPYSWSRDIPLELAIEITKKYSNNYHIIHITRADGYQLPYVERIDQIIPNMELFALLYSSAKRIFIDSALQHASKALGLKSNVIWIATSPINFGYELHNNIIAKRPSTHNQLLKSYTTDYLLGYNEEECPYMNLSEMFNIPEVLNSLGN